MIWFSQGDALKAALKFPHLAYWYVPSFLILKWSETGSCSLIALSLLLWPHGSSWLMFTLSLNSYIDHYEAGILAACFPQNYFLYDLSAVSFKSSLEGSRRRKWINKKKEKWFRENGMFLAAGITFFLVVVVGFFWWETCLMSSL